MKTFTNKHIAIGHFDGESPVFGIIDFEPNTDLCDVLQGDLRKETGSDYDGVDFYEDNVSSLSDLMESPIISGLSKNQELTPFIAVFHYEDESAFAKIVLADDESKALGVIDAYIESQDDELHFDGCKAL